MEHSTRDTACLWATPAHLVWTSWLMPTCGWTVTLDSALTSSSISLRNSQGGSYRWAAWLWRDILGPLQEQPIPLTGWDIAPAPELPVLTTKCLSSVWLDCHPWKTKKRRRRRRRRWKALGGHRRPNDEAPTAFDYYHMWWFECAWPRVGTIRRCDLIGVGVALLKEVCNWRVGPVSDSVSLSLCVCVCLSFSFPPSLIFILCISIYITLILSVSFFRVGGERYLARASHILNKCPATELYPSPLMFTSYFESGFHMAMLAFKLTMSWRLALDFFSFYLQLPRFW